VTWETIETKDFYFVDEVAAILRMDVASVRRLLKAPNKMPKHQDKKGGKIRIRHCDLEAYVERMRVDVEPEKEHPQKLYKSNAQDKVCG